MEGTYKGVVLHKYQGKLSVEEVPHRKLENDEILVKIHCCSILPADLALLQGMYGKYLPDLPRVFGLEGSGEIVAVAENVDKSIIGKRCGVSGVSSSNNFHGVWSEYCYSSINTVLIFDIEIPYEKICNSLVNPLTAAGFIETIKSHGSKSVAHTGASTAFGRMFMKLCITEGIEVINIVRKAESIDELKKLGGTHFVNTSNENWQDELKLLCEKLDVSILFECVGGSITGKCLSCIKNYGVIYHFGNLELSRLSDIDTNDFVFGHKRLEGWNAGDFIKNSSEEKLESWRLKIKNDFEENNGNIFKTEYREKTFKLDQIEEAFGEYLTSSGGKVLILP